MVKQYPHRLVWQTEGTPSQKNPATGFPVPGGLPTNREAKARYENFNKGAVKEFTNKNGKTVLQKGTIYVKFKEPYPLKFETVKVISPDYGVVFEGEILEVYKGQMNTTIIV